MMSQVSCVNLRCCTSQSRSSQIALFHYAVTAHSQYAGGFWKTEVSVRKTNKCFPSTLRWKNLKTQQLPLILNLCSSKTRTGEYRNYRNLIFWENLRFQIVFRPH